MAHAVTMGADGRVVIPVELRRELGLEPGDELVVRRSGDSLLLARPATEHSLADVIWEDDEGGGQPTDWLAPAG